MSLDELSPEAKVIGEAQLRAQDSMMHEASFSNTDSRLLRFHAACLVHASNELLGMVPALSHSRRGNDVLLKQVEHRGSIPISAVAKNRILAGGGFP